MDDYLRVELSKNIFWDQAYPTNTEHKFVWNTGSVTPYWYEVKGCCKDLSASNPDVCPPINPNSECKNKSQYFQIILANSAEELCQELNDIGWNWKLCSVKKWSKPALNSATNNSNSICNVLEAVDFKKITECVSLSTEYSEYVKIKVLTTVTFTKNSPATTTTTSSPLIQSYKTLHSPPESRLKILLLGQSFIFTGNGKINFSNNSGKLTYKFPYYGDGKISFNSSCIVYASAYRYVAELNYGSFSDEEYNESYDTRRYIKFSGYAGLVSSNWEYSPVTKSLRFRGEADYPIRKDYFPEGFVYFNGKSKVRWSGPDNNNLFYDGSGSIVFSAEPKISNKWSYEASGAIVFSSNYYHKGNFLGTFETKIRVKIEPTQPAGSDLWNCTGLVCLIPSYEEMFLQSLYFAPADVSVKCYGCSALPGLLYFNNNLTNLNLLNNVLNRNSQEIQENIQLTYDSKQGLWTNIFHYKDKYLNEDWKMVFDFGCVNYSGNSGDVFFNQSILDTVQQDWVNSGRVDLSGNPITLEDYLTQSQAQLSSIVRSNNSYNDSNYYWRFSMYVTRTLKDGTDFDTRLYLTVPSEFICQYKSEFSFSFKYDIIKKYFFIGYQAYYDNFTFYDNIGLFSSSYWKSNPEINFTVSKNKIENKTTKTTLYV